MTAESKVESEERSEEATKEEIESYDLTGRISPYLDLHMMFPLLEYVDGLIAQGGGLIKYSSQDVAAARLSLLRPTHMVDYAMDIYRELHGTEEAPEEMEEQKAKVFERLEELRVGCRKVDELFRDEGGIRSKLTKDGQWTMESVTSNKDLGVTKEMIETYRQLAKFNYDCGDYEAASSMLECYLSLFASPPQRKDSMSDDEDSIMNENKPTPAQQQPTTTEGNPAMYYLREVNSDLLQVLWGRLSCLILLERWDEAQVALTAVKTGIDTLAAAPSTTKNRIPPLQALQQRTWLLHWSLFVFWNDSAKKGLDHLMELFFSERYLQAVTTNAPHLLRYLTAAVLLSKRRLAKSNASIQSSSTSALLDSRRLMKDLVRVMQHCDYTDPIVQFVDCLCVKFDFDSAQHKLSQCEAVLSTDFFLCKQTQLFMEEARVFIFENYCRIHYKIDLNALAQKLAMDQAHAERWIVDLIRNALLDAKIDSEEKCVVMGTNVTSVYEQVMEKTRDLNVRSTALVSNLSNLIAESKKEKKRKEQARIAALDEDDDDEY